jgi:mono/diheme cytochrome c family protein
MLGFNVRFMEHAPTIFRIAASAILLLNTAGCFVFGAAQRPPPGESVERTPERLERGRYLSEVVIGCNNCHSRIDKGRFGFPVDERTRGGGGECWDARHEVPGVVCATNITPDRETGIGNWTDGELMRALREGVSRDGRTLFPLMPWKTMTGMSDEDTRAVIAYVRTLPPIRKQAKQTELDFPVNLFIKAEPEPLEGPVPDPDRKDRVAYGRYMAEIAGCRDCHTPVNSRGAYLKGLTFAGGRRFVDPNLMPEYTANLTPDSRGLIRGRTRAEFIAQFKSFESMATEPPQVLPAGNTLMPWLNYSRMSEADLGAIYDFLRTLPSVDRIVDRRKGVITDVSAEKTR